jgi:hypothetical protein
VAFANDCRHSLAVPQKREQPARHVTVAAVNQLALQRWKAACELGEFA